MKRRSRRIERKVSAPSSTGITKIEQDEVGRTRREPGRGFAAIGRTTGFHPGVDEDGTIEVSSNERDGTKFTIRLPDQASASPL